MAGEAILNNRYELVAQQGSGGMSVIYRAVDRALERTVAVKVLRPSLTQDPSFLEKFQQEARSIANLAHPNIVTVYDVGNDGQTHYMVMELVDGQDLKRIIKQHGALPVDRVLNLIIQVCSGLDYAHRSGIVHADVKPQNLLVTSQDVVKVTDFGIAQALSNTQPRQRMDVVWGSPHYFAPEQARGEQPTPASDVYAIGIVMFEMLTGQLPYKGMSQQELAMAHIKDPIPLVSDLNPDIPDALARIVHKVMSKDPGGRFRRAAQLGNVLKDFQNKASAHTASNPQVPSSAGTPPPPPGPASSAPPRNRPPGVGISSPSPSAAASESEPTMRYSAAPNAPQPYDPRQAAPAQPGSPTSPPQPLEQRYSVPPPAPLPQAQAAPTTVPPAPSSDSGSYSQYVSRPMTTADEGPDMVTIALAVLAFIAVAGLCPLALVVISAYS